MHTVISANFQISERGTNERKRLKRGTFLNCLYITIYIFLQKKGTHSKITLFLVSKRGTVGSVSVPVTDWNFSDAKLLVHRAS